jgi:hypothetical protein
MKKIFLFVLPAAMILFSCSKNSGGGSTASTTLKKVVVHTTGSSEIDTLAFNYDNQGRLSEFTSGAIDTIQGSSSYYAYSINFLYSGTNTLPFEDASNDNQSDAIVDLLTFNSNGQLTIDSTLGDYTLYINYGTNLIANSYFTNGIPYYNSDSLWFSGSNVSQWAEDTIVDPTASPVVLSRYFLLTYDSYTAYNNPLYTFFPLAGILFENTGLDPAFFYSKNLLSSESEDGISYNYTYVLNGTTVQQANGFYILDFYY